MNVSFVTVINLPTKFEHLVKIGPECSEIFGVICQFLPSFVQMFKNFSLCLLKVGSYWVDVHHVFTRCRGTIAAIIARIYKTI